jgi:hypothetical protein
MIPENNIASGYVRKTGIAWLVLGMVIFGILVGVFHREDYASSEAYYYYYGLIENVRAGTGAIQHPVIPPLLPWAQGMFMRATGIHDPVLGAQWMNLGLLLPLNLLLLWRLLGRLARDKSRQRTALQFGIALVLLNPLIIWRSLLTSNELLYGVCLNAFFLCSMRYLDHRNKRALVPLALAAALCALARSEGAIWPAVASLGLLYFHRFSARMFRRQVLLWLVVLLVWLPRLSHMQALTGYPILDIRIVNVLRSIGCPVSGSVFRTNPSSMQVLYPVQQSATATTLERRANSTPTLHQNFTWRAIYSLRGMMITFGPLGILYLLWSWPAGRRRVAENWNTHRLFGLHALLLVQVLAVTISVWFEERYGSTILVPLSLTGGIVLAEATACLPRRWRTIMHVLLAVIMAAWAALVMWRIPTHRLEQAVARALRERVPPGSVIMSQWPTIPYELKSKMCRVPDWQHHRIKISSAQLVAICREAGVDFIVWGEFPMWRHPWWQQDAAARAIIRDFSLPLNLPAGADGQPIVVIDARRLSGR